MAIGATGSAGTSGSLGFYASLDLHTQYFRLIGAGFRAETSCVAFGVSDDSGCDKCES